jgi:phosphoglucosamine mutase
VGDYVAHLIGSLAPGALRGLTVVLDGANGAASGTAVAAFEGQGASVHPIHTAPDGYNINRDCGSTHVESLQAAVVARRADLGLAFDGDADRCLAVDHTGALVDGDQILAILALSLKAQGRLHLDTVVATVMSNLGFIQAMQAHGITVDTTKDGDRYVLESMNDNNFTLGGEQSGHVILSDYATTGDGVLTGLHLAARVAATGRPLAELAAVMARLPQVTLNVAGIDKARVNLDHEVNEAVKRATQDLAGRGRILLRPSGTEPVVRIMVEAPTAGEAERIAHGLVTVVKARLSVG